VFLNCQDLLADHFDVAYNIFQIKNVSENKPKIIYKLIKKTSKDLVT